VLRGWVTVFNEDNAERWHGAEKYHRGTTAEMNMLRIRA
jgi:hypothetical protein